MYFISYTNPEFQSFWKAGTFNFGDKERVGYQNDTGKVLWRLNTVRESVKLGQLLSVARVFSKRQS